MGTGGDYEFEIVGPSPELEARWGPNAMPAAADDHDAVADESAHHVTAALIMPNQPALPHRPRRGRLLVAAAIAAMVGLVAVAFVVGETGDDTRTVTAAAEGADDDLVVDDESAEAAQAFLERWQAGPSTTMPLGAAGVPLSERPTTTTSASTSRRNAPTTGTGAGTSTGPGRVAAPGGTEPEPTLRADDPRLADAERAARAFVDAMMRRDCEAVWSALSDSTRSFFEAMSEDGRSMKDELCASLRDESIPTITVRPPARPYHEGALIDMEVEGEVEPLYLILENGVWKVDLLGEMDEEEFDEPEDAYADDVQADLDHALVAERVRYTDWQSYTDDLPELRQIEPALEWRAGIAPGDAPVGAVYVALAENGQVVCLSARDADGVRHMVKDNASLAEPTYAFGSIPATCDAQPLAEPR